MQNLFGLLAACVVGLIAGSLRKNSCRWTAARTRHSLHLRDPLPPAPGGLGKRRRQPPLGPGRIPTTARRRPPAAKHGRAGAHATCTRHVFRARTRRAHGAFCAHTRRVSRRAEQRISRRTEQRVSRRAERRVLRRAEPRVSRHAERRASRHANGVSTDAQTSASFGAQTARLFGVQSVTF